MELESVPVTTISTHPGEILLEEFLKPMGISQVDLAKHINISIQSVNDICKGRRGITNETAILLSRAFNTSVHFWINLQFSYELSKKFVEDPSYIEKINNIKKMENNHE